MTISQIEYEPIVIEIDDTGVGALAYAAAKQAQDSEHAINKIWCGSSATDPTHDLNGDPVAAGCLYFNTDLQALNAFNGTDWVLYSSEVSVATEEEAVAGTINNKMMTPATTVAAFTRSPFLSPGSTVPRSILDRFGGVVDVRDHGAKADFLSGSPTDDSAAFQSAINYAATKSRPVYIPDGHYHLASTASDLDPGVAPLTIIGQSRLGTVLHFDEGTGALNSGYDKTLFRNDAKVEKAPLQFENFQIKGTWDARKAQWGGFAFLLRYYPAVTFRNVWINGTTCGAIQLIACSRAEVTGSWFTENARDANFIRETPDVLIDGNFYWRSGDDSISVHNRNASMADVQNIRERIIITNNRLLNAGLIKSLGGRKVRIDGNISVLPNVGGIAVYQEPPESNIAMFDIQVTNNIITDPVVVTSGTATADAAYYISVEGIQPRGGTSTNDIPPYRYDATSGKIIRPWDHYHHDLNDSTQPAPPTECVTISGNIGRRTMPAAAKFSDYGYGKVNRLGVEYDPAITDLHLRAVSGIKSDTAGFHGLSITGNKIRNTKAAIQLPAPSSPDSYRHVRITDNEIHDSINRGIWVGSPVSVTSIDLEVARNIIDCDPFRENANSNIDGSYIANSIPIAIDLGNNVGVAVGGNYIRNACQLVASNAPTKLIWSLNTVYSGIPAALSTFNSGNKGIGTIVVDPDRFRHVIVDADPTSVDYGLIQSVPTRSGFSIPTSGWYPKGHIVFNNTVTIASGKSLIGWQRLTTGSDHVVGTDWTPLYVTTA